jgi:hypothetical protein
MTCKRHTGQRGKRAVRPCRDPDEKMRLVMEPAHAFGLFQLPEPFKEYQTQGVPEM